MSSNNDVFKMNARQLIEYEQQGGEGGITTDLSTALADKLHEAVEYLETALDQITEWASDNEYIFGKNKKKFAIDHLRDFCKANINPDDLKSMSTEEKNKIINAIKTFPNASILASVLIKDSDVEVKMNMAACLVGLDMAEVLANRVVKDNDYSVREVLAANLKGLLNAKELSIELANDPVSTVRESLAHNIDGLDNRVDLAEIFIQDNDTWVIKALIGSISDLPKANAVDIASRINEKLKTSFDEGVSKALLEAGAGALLEAGAGMTELEAGMTGLEAGMTGMEVVTFHLPADNKASTGHDANLWLSLNKNDLDRIEQLKQTALTIDASSIAIEAGASKGRSLTMDLSGITFDANDAPAYKIELFITNKGFISAKVKSDELHGEFESCCTSMTIAHIKKAYEHALEVGAEHAVINDELGVSFYSSAPNFIYEEQLLMASDYNAKYGSHLNLLADNGNKQQSANDPSF